MLILQGNPARRTLMRQIRLVLGRSFNVRHQDDESVRSRTRNTACTAVDASALRRTAVCCCSLRSLGSGRMGGLLAISREPLVWHHSAGSVGGSVRVACPILAASQPRSFVGYGSFRGARLDSVYLRVLFAINVRLMPNHRLHATRMKPRAPEPER